MHLGMKRDMVKRKSDQITVTSQSHLTLKVNPVLLVFLDRGISFS